LSEARREGDPSGADQARAIARGLALGVRQFNRGDYFECHDTLEEVWMSVRGAERAFFQGLIQVSVGYYHLEWGNLAGAEHLLTRGIEKLSRYAWNHRQLDLHRLLQQARGALDLVIRGRNADGRVRLVAPRPTLRATAPCAGGTFGAIGDEPSLATGGARD
jgi:hypothetical protein